MNVTFLKTPPQFVEICIKRPSLINTPSFNAKKLKRQKSLFNI